ncbi:hypothetical protein [Mycobacterium sp.]|uniref:hypothetical protein n=1 Tax=Mycobacterium sp. TaxID=1785 RepID=UPI002B86AF99|nr:hypothetical protein [Mycobacterium sp.]HKP42790.1 hypothetical protein [Mycobacterium sp.]
MTRAPRWLKLINRLYMVLLRRGVYFSAEYTEHVQLVELPPQDARPVLRLVPVQVPAGIGFLKNSGLVSDGTPEELEELAGVLPVFRVDAA